MAITDAFTLPNQPGVGAVTWVPLGGDGVTAPIGYYDVDVRLVGDASGGNAVIAVTFDARYTSLLSWSNVKVFADTAAGEFSLTLARSGAFSGINVVGTFPGVAESFVTANSCYLWYPPPIFYAGDGRLQAHFINVDATETYVMQCQVFAYFRDVRNRMNMTWLHQISPSTNSPVAS